MHAIKPLATDGGGRDRAWAPPPTPRNAPAHGPPYPWHRGTGDRRGMVCVGPFDRALLSVPGARLRQGQHRPHRTAGRVTPHRVIGVLHRVPGVLHRVLEVQQRAVPARSTDRVTAPHPTRFLHPSQML